MAILPRACTSSSRVKGNCRQLGCGAGLGLGRGEHKKVKVWLAAAWAGLGRVLASQAAEQQRFTFSCLHRAGAGPWHGAGVRVKNASSQAAATGHSPLSILGFTERRWLGPAAQSHSLMLCPRVKLSGSVHGSGSANKRDVQILRSHCTECGV